MTYILRRTSNSLRRSSTLQSVNAYRTQLTTNVLRRDIAAKKGCTPGQLTLAWILALGEDIFVIPGTKQEKYMRENIAAQDVILTPDEVTEITEITKSKGGNC